MVTIVPVSVEGGVPSAIQGTSSQNVVPMGHVYGHNLHRHHQGPRGHRSSPSRFGHRLHHHHHHLKGPHSLAHQHGHVHLSHGGRRHHGGPDHGLRGRHVSRGLHDVAGREHGPHFRLRRHRSLSPHHLIHNRSSDGTPGSPHRGNRGNRGGHRGHCSRVPRDINFQGIFFREHHLHNLHSQDPNSGSGFDRSSPQPAGIEQGIEQLGQLSLRSESGAF